MPQSDQKPKRPAENRQQHALGKKLRIDAKAARSERGSKGNFFLSGGGASKQQVRNVRAGN